MYSKIEIYNTDYPNKYLFIKDENLFFGGFVVKDIVELLKIEKTTDEIVSEISKKYKTDIDKTLVENIINNDLKELVEKTKKKKMIKIFKVILPKNPTYPSFLLNLFSKNIFYPLLLTTFVINSIYFYLTDIELNLSGIEKFYAFMVLLIILIFHELGHIISAKFDGINVRETGLAIYAIIPVLYVNLNESWKLNRQKKIRINLSGIYFQSIIGVIICSLIKFTNINDGFLWYLFSANFVVLGLNLNPFFKFDGYWVLNDLLKENNLEKDSSKFLKSIFKKDKNNFSLKIKVFAILKFCFLIVFFSFLIIQLSTFIYDSYINDKTQNFLIIVAVILFLIISNLIRNGFRFNKTKGRNKE